MGRLKWAQRRALDAVVAARSRTALLLLAGLALLGGGALLLAPLARPRGPHAPLCPACRTVDAVYTWVNGSEPALRAAMAARATHGDDLAPERFDDKQELKYSLRSLEKYAPWVGHVYIVTAGQLPSWLDIRNSKNFNSNSRLTLISHEDIIPQEYLPTFSSPAIECFLHKIPGLSETFLYINDDIFLGDSVHLSDFYTSSEGYEVYTAWSVPDCAQGCPWSFLGDNSCDRACDNAACDFDGGDCSGNSETRRLAPGNHLDYLGDYADNPFFDEDEKPDYEGVKDLGKYPGLDRPVDDPKIGKTRQIEDGELLQNLLDRNDNKMAVIKAELNDDDRFASRKLNVFPPLNMLSKIKPDYSNITSEDDIVLSERALKNISKLKKKNKTNRRSGRNATDAEKVESNDNLFSSKNTEKHSKSDKNIFKNIIERNVNNISDAIHNYNDRFIKTNKVIRKRSKLSSSSDYGNASLPRTYSDTRKLDVFARSLIHTNKIFNKVYGFQNRKVPAHVPFLMEKSVIEKMHEKFSEHIEVTKRNKFRRPNDFQFAFAYYHYLMSEKEEYTIEEIFDIYDTDKSGTWSDREIRTVLARVRGPPLTAAAVHALESAAKVCDSDEHRAHPTPPNERYMDSDMPTLTKKLVVECPGLRGPLRGALGHRKPRAFPRPATSRTTFAMLSSNITRAVIALDEIRRDTKKFICINDNLDPNREAENEIVRMVLQELYEALLPLPSQWELPPHVANRFSRMSELQAWQSSRDTASRTLAACAIILIMLTMYQLNCWGTILNRIKTKF